MNYDSFPPINLFKKILLHNPKSALMFLDLYAMSKKGKTENLIIPKSSIKRVFKHSQTLFRNNLLAYSRLDILTFDESIESFYVRFGKLDEKKS